MKSHMSLIQFFTPFAIAFLGFACSKPNSNPVGAEFYAYSGMGSEKFISLYAASDDTSFQVPASLAKSPYLYVGQYRNTHAQSVLRFPSIDTAGKIDSAKMVLHLRNIQSDNQSHADLRIREVTQPWDEDIDEKFFGESMLGDELHTLIRIDTSSNSVFIAMPVDLVNQWRDTTSESNHGIHLSSVSDAMLQFYAYESAAAVNATPQLWIYFHEDSLGNPEIFSYVKDVTLATSTFEPTTDRLIIESGTAVRSVIAFDLEQIPINATINKATLTFSVDTLETLYDQTPVMELTAYNLSDKNRTFEAMSYDSLYAETGFLIDDMAEFEVTKLTQLIVSAFLNNNGFLLKSASESGLLTRASLFSTSADSARQPRLDIYYALPPR